MGENPAALRAAVFSLASKNLRGAFKRPPPAGRGLKNYSLRQFCMYAIAYMQNYMLDVCNFAFCVHVSLLS